MTTNDANASANDGGYNLQADLDTATHDANQGGDEHQQNDEGQNDEGEDELGNPDGTWPKKFTNALNRRDYKIRQQGKSNADLRAERDALQRQLQEATKGGSGGGNRVELKEPSAADPQYKDDYGRFLVDKAKFELARDYNLTPKEAAKVVNDALNANGQGQPQNDQNKQPEAENPQLKAWVEERSNSVATATTDFVKDMPPAQQQEVVQLFVENHDILADFPPHIEHAFLAATNAPAAFFALAKEEKLEEIARMNPAQAAAAIAQAEQRGLKMLKGKTISDAPAPQRPNRGNGAPTKSLDNQDVDGVMKSLGLRN